MWQEFFKNLGQVAEVMNFVVATAALVRQFTRPKK